MSPPSLISSHIYFLNKPGCLFPVVFRFPLPGLSPLHPPWCCLPYSSIPSLSYKVAIRSKHLIRFKFKVLAQILPRSCLHFPPRHITFGCLSLGAFRRLWCSLPRSVIWLEIALLLHLLAGILLQKETLLISSGFSEVQFI